MRAIWFHWRLALSIIVGFQILALLSIAWTLGGALVMSQLLQYLLTPASRLIQPTATIGWLVVQIGLVALTAKFAKWVAGDILAARVIQVIGVLIVVIVLVLGSGLLAPTTPAG